MTPCLFTPMRVGGLSLPNRIFVSPMCQYSATDGVMQAWHRQHLGCLSLAGAGMVIIEATAVAAEGRITPGCTGLHSDNQEQRLLEILTDIRSYSNAAFGIQLGHTGRRASMYRPWEGVGAVPVTEGGWRSFGPSPLPYMPGWPVPQVLDEAGMTRIRDAFVSSAQRARRIGLSLVELHSAHGYLMHQFLSPVANQRTDSYGGSLNNRMRYPLSIVQAVRDIWPAELALGVRISATDWRDDGWTVDDSIVFVRALRDIGVDYVCVSSGGMGGGMTSLSKEHLPFAARIRRETGMTICGVGQIYKPQQAEAALAQGQADIIALGRAFLDNPRWGWHAAVALGAEPAYPRQYDLARPDIWRGYTVVHGAS